MAVAYRSHTAQTTTGSGAIVINKPSGVVDGDVLIGFFSEDTDTPRITPPAGWTAFSGTGIGTNGVVVDGTYAVLQAFYKVASGEGASWSFTPSGTYTGISGVIAYSGADTTTPIDVAAGTSTASSTTHTSATITPSVANTMLVGIWMVDSNASNSWSTSDMTERVDQNSGTTQWVSLSVHDLLYASTSAVSKTATFTASDTAAVLLVAIKPASSGITGDASVTQAADTVSAAGVVAIAGDASVTEAADTASADGSVAIAGDASATQAADTLSADGTVSSAGITGSASITQAADTSSAAGVVAIAGAASITEAADTVAADGAVAIQGAASVTQAADTSTAAGTVTGHVIAETVVGSTTSSASITLTSWTPAANEFIGIWVACRSAVTATAVSGNGITFAKVIEDTGSPQNQCTLSFWRGMSASPTTGSITVTLSGSAIAAVAVAHRITGAATGGSNGSAAVGATAIINTGATDTTAPSVDITTTAASSRVLGGATHRAQTYTVGAGETAISINNSVGTAGDVTSLSTEYQDVASISTVTINGTLASATDWIQGAVEIKAAGGSGVSGDASITQASDTASAAGVVAIAGDASITEAADTASAAGVVAIAGAAAITQAGDTSSADGSVAIVGAASISQAADTLSASGGVPTVLGDLAVTQAGDTASAAGAVAIVGAASITQAPNTLSATGGNVVTLTPWARNSFSARADVAAAIPAVGRSFSVAADAASEQV